MRSLHTQWRLVGSLLVACLMGLVAVPAAAQTQDTGTRASDTDRAGTAGAAQLLVPMTARHVALGNASTSGLANLNGLEALYANPAGLALNTGTTALFSRMEYVADIGVNYFGVGQRIGNNNLAFTVSTWDFGDIPKQTEARPEQSSVTFSPTFITAGLSYARQLTDRIAAGTTVKLVNEEIEDMTGTAVAFDAGMTYVVGESGLRLGVSLKNFGSDLTYSGVGLNRSARVPQQRPDANNNALLLEAENAELPSLLNFGLSYTREVGAATVVRVLGNFRSNSFEDDEFSGGLELGFRELVYVRGGYEVRQDMDRTFYTGARFGAGLNLEIGESRLTVDYAYTPTDFFDDVQFITASVTL